MRQAAKRSAARLLASTGLLTPIHGDVTRLDLGRRHLATRLVTAANRIHDYLTHVGLEHLPARLHEPRWGHGRPLHPQLLKIVAEGRARYESIIDDVLSYRDELLAIPTRQIGDTEPCWVNSWFPALDTAVLYSLIRSRAPSRYIEVGSGFSTRVASRAIRDGKLSTQLISIDPQPRAFVDELCDMVVRKPLEEVPDSFWESLKPGDLVFVDNSHRVLMHSDVTVFFLEILPNLPAGVVVGLHDILLPADYFASWGEYMFSEQYLLAAYLLARAPWLKPMFAAYWASELSDTAAPLEILWDALQEDRLDRRGWSIWFEIERHQSVPA